VTRSDHSSIFILNFVFDLLGLFYQGYKNFVMFFALYCCWLFSCLCRHQMCFTGHVWMSLLAVSRQTRLQPDMPARHVILACSLQAMSSLQLWILCETFCLLSTGPGLVWDCHWQVHVCSSHILYIILFAVLYKGRSGSV